MRNAAINFFKKLSQNKIEVQQMDAAIHDYMKNYDPKETIPINCLERSHLDNQQFLDKHRQDVASFLHKAVDLEDRLWRKNYVDNINFSISSVDSIRVSTMSLAEREKALLEIKLRLNTCPFLFNSSFIVYDFGYLIWVEWTMPMPIKLHGFSKDQLEKFESNILQYFSRYFDTQDCTLQFFPIFGLDDAIQCHPGDDFYYDKVFFPHVFLECLGLSIDYKLA